MENARHVPTNKYSTNDLRAKELPFFLLLNKEDDDSLATVATFINVASNVANGCYFY
jgi:hypothetical protein